MRKIQDVPVENKKVLLRVGFDVSLENGTVKEQFKIKAVADTLEYLLDRKARLALLTWFGRPGGKKDLRYSVSQMKEDVEEILGHPVKFIPDCIGKEVASAISELAHGEIALLENVRFYPEEGDVETGLPYEVNFAQELAASFDLFVNDAFSQSHRNQASIVGIPKFLPSAAGWLLQKELEVLEKVRKDPRHPAVAVIGGAKIETKIPVIKAFEKEYDWVLVGGKIANEALDQKLAFSEKVLLPFDFLGSRMDIGSKTLEKFQQIIRGAETVVWNGPMGKFEEPAFEKGTYGILDAILESQAFSVMGGGESIEVLEARDAMNQISFVSTGGGAMLEYLSGKQLPGLAALEEASLT